MREYKEIIHTKEERALGEKALLDFKKKSAILLNEYLDKEKPLRVSHNYMTLRKPFLQAYKEEEE